MNKKTLYQQYIHLIILIWVLFTKEIDLTAQNMNRLNLSFVGKMFSTFNRRSGNKQSIQQPYNKPQAKPKQDEPKQQLIYGLNPVEAALHANKRKIYQLYISDSQMIQLNSKTMKLINFAKQKNIPLTYIAKNKLDRMSSQSPHQNVMLKCSPLPFETIALQDYSKFSPGIYVYTDKITDPQNFGAIIRSSLFFGVKQIFAAKKNHCPLNATVSKASTGAVELMNVSLVDKSQDFLKMWKQSQGTVMSTQVSNTHQKIYPVQDLQLLKKQDNLQKILIILGSQGFGVSSHLKKYSDYNILIERKGNKQYPFSLIDSLNVNAALTSILFQLTKDVQV